MELGSVPVARTGSQVEVPLTLSTTDTVQGLVAAFEWDGAAGAGVDLRIGPAIEDADTIVTRVEPDYIILGIVMDDDGQGNEAIEPGEDLLLATAVIECSGGTTEVRFADARYATVEGGPALSNIVVVDGLSVSTAEGLELRDGDFSCSEPRYRLYVDSARASNQTEKAPILLDTADPVEGFVVALAHDPTALELRDITLGPDAAIADFTSVELFVDGGVFGVVMDLVDPQPAPPVVGPGTELEVANFWYRCLQPPGDPTTAVPLEFTDGVLGEPPKSNVLVVGGVAIESTEGLFLEDGTFTCFPGCLPSDPDESLLYGNCSDGRDNDCDGLIDLDDPGCLPSEAGQTFLCGSRDVDPGTRLPLPQEAPISTEVDVCFYLLNPEDGLPGLAQFDQVQGFSMALTYCCDIEAVGALLDISGTILEAIGAEYISVQADNDPADGDGCELIIGVLVDALPPFDGATIPPLDWPQLMGCVTFRIRDDAACGAPCPLEFTDGINGTGKVPINNLVSVENISRGVTTVSCELQVVDEPRFYRGDCNFSRGSTGDGRLAVDIADAAAVVSFLFAPALYKFEPPCLDACDCNDDGRIDLADAVCILKYLFQGGRFPPDPGPGWRETGLPNPDAVEPSPSGPDPTLDLLDCAGGTGCR